MNTITKWWDGLKGSTKAVIEAGAVVVATPVVDALYQQLSAVAAGTGGINGAQLEKAMVAGLAAGGLYSIAYLRGLLVLPSGGTVPVTQPPATPKTTP